MYAAKQAHTGHAFYSPDQHQYSPARLGLVAQLARAMDSHELVLHYQPKANLRTGEIDGVEALVRWHHPQRGLLYPGEFIPVTERTSLIRPVTIHLLERALDQICDWEREGRGLSIAVNLSAQILLDLGLPGEIGRMLSRVGAPPERLELEVTESAIMYDPRRTKRVLDELHEMGLRVAIDDFGTGYSSLVSLRTLPISTIKIDKSFVMGMEHDANDAAIVKSTAQLGSNLGLTVVAEGVETPAAWNELKQLGCDYAQGYYLSKPLDSEQFMRWLVAYRGLFEDRLQAPARPRRLPAMAGAGLPAIATGHTGADPYHEEHRDAFAHQPHHPLGPQFQGARPDPARPALRLEPRGQAQDRAGPPPRRAPPVEHSGLLLGRRDARAHVQCPAGRHRDRAAALDELDQLFADQLAAPAPERADVGVLGVLAPAHGRDQRCQLGLGGDQLG
ncbi:MAG: putative bifunctional diguanylate cyclase/phosphodiesterase, partial [Thermoleophilaceae bacterium]